MKKKTYSTPEVQTITMLTEGMIAGSGNASNTGDPAPRDIEKKDQDGGGLDQLSRGFDGSDNSIWD